MESVKTALRIFEAVAARPATGVSELARALEEPKTTVQRCLTTLHEAGWLQPRGSGRSRSWTPSPRVATLLHHAGDTTLIREAARPVMERLRAETGETINLMQRDDRRMVLIDRLESPHPLRSVQALGVRVPMHLSSNGKAFLAAAPDNEVAAYLAAPLERGTPDAIVTPEGLRREIAQIRRQGFATNRGELESGVRAVAAAIRNAAGAPVASLSISCPAMRLPEAKMTGYGALARAAAAEITAHLPL